MKTKIIILMSMIFLLNGCAGLPLGLQIASWIKTVGDVGSYVATEKSLTDHAVSSLKEEDCAFHRLLLGDDVCKPIVVKDETIKPNITDVKIEVLFPPEIPKIKTEKTSGVIINWDAIDYFSKIQIDKQSSVIINWDAINYFSGVIINWSVLDRLEKNRI